MASNAAEAEAKVARADAQLHDYGTALLAGFELHRTRYVVVVTSERLPLPGDRDVAGVRFRRVNIAVTPSTPSSNA